MITRAEIAAVTADELTETEQELWKTLIRQYKLYSPITYPELDTKLVEITGIPAKQLIVALGKIEAIGSNTVIYQGAGDGVDYSRDRDRNLLIRYGLSVLYDTPGRYGIVNIGMITQAGADYLAENINNQNSWPDLDYPYQYYGGRFPYDPFDPSGGTPQR